VALQAVVHRERYSYSETVDMMTAENIEKSKAYFNQFVQDGIILGGQYSDKYWVMTDEVIKGAKINFQINEVHFAKDTGPRLGCSLKDYEQTMRLVITSRFGYAIKHLQSVSAAMRDFAYRYTIPTDYEKVLALIDLLDILPGNTPFRDSVRSELDDISPLNSETGKQRRLSHYQSYLRFSDILTDYWKTAEVDDKILYFPIWFWYSITGVLPLRPTECVLTPRHCIAQRAGRYYLTVCRSRKKGTIQSTRYRKDLDYTLCEYPIPEKLALPILEYIAATENVYESDVDVLFCKSSQFSKIQANCGNDHHYTYYNLKQCLSYFYKYVVQEKYRYEIVVDQENLAENEIQKIHLGDTRHMAMIALAVSGGSPTICKELAGHDSIAISSHYYSNLSEFLDVLGYQRFRNNEVRKETAYSHEISMQFPVGQGFCQCKQVWEGDFTPCKSAVDSDGMPGSCAVCRWYLPQRNWRLEASAEKEKAADALKLTCTLLRQAIEQVRKGLGNEETISCILDRLSAQSNQYMRASAIERLYKEMER